MAKTKKFWSYSAGEAGRNRVRVYEDNRSGVLMIEHHDRGRRNRTSLGHRDRQRAKRAADEAAARLAAHERVRAATHTLRALFDMYLAEVTPTKSPGKQAHDRRTAPLFLSVFGDGCEVANLSRRDWDRFIRLRRKGGLVFTSGVVTKPVGDRQVEYDLAFLKAVLNWALAARDRNGDRLLTQMPFEKTHTPRERSPRRPIISTERYEAMLKVAPQVDWRFEAALVVAHETGRRIGSIRFLRWSDVDFVAQTLVWRKEHDKGGRDQVTPLTRTAVEALERARKVEQRIGECWVFPSPLDASRAVSRHLVRDWWKQAERLAALDPVKGLGWHSLRRKFATDCWEAPLKTICELGGWNEPTTLLRCYQQPDEAAMRQVLQQRRSAV